MALSHGKNAVLYLGANTAVPVTQTHTFDGSLQTDMADVTAHGAAFKVYLPGLKDYKQKVDAYYDDAYWTMVDAAFNNTALRHYLYPDRNNTANYFSGLVYLSLDSLNSPTGDANKESFSMMPAGTIIFTHA
jgi:hypothetical protein